MLVLTTGRASNTTVVINFSYAKVHLCYIQEYAVYPHQDLHPKKTVYNCLHN